MDNGLKGFGCTRGWYSMGLIITMLVLSSCQGQETSDSKLALGDLVSGFPPKIWSVYQDYQNVYWFGSNGEGIFKYDGETIVQFTTAHGLIDDQIRGIRGDNKGRIFIQTPSGVSSYDGTAFRDIPVQVAPISSWALAPDDHWFNCNGNSLQVMRNDGIELTEFQLPEIDLYEAFGWDVTGVPFSQMNNSPYAVYGIDRSPDGIMCFGTVSAGAFLYDGHSFLSIAEPELSTLPDGRVPGVRSILQDKQGYYWMSNFRSKYRIMQTDSSMTYEKSEGVLSAIGDNEDLIGYFNSGLRDAEGTIWATTYGDGVWKYDGDTMINYPVKLSEADVLIVSIYEDRQGKLWLGSDNAGLFYFDGEGFERFVTLQTVKH